MQDGANSHTGHISCHVQKACASTHLLLLPWLLPYVSMEKTNMSVHSTADAVGHLWQWWLESLVEPCLLQVEMRQADSCDVM